MTKEKEAETEGIRLQKILAKHGVGSRREIERMILENLITVNGESAKIGQRVIPGKDRIMVQGEGVKIDKPVLQKVYAFYKPKSCVTTLHDPEGRLTVKEFFPATKERLFPVGRLDYDAEGLLLLTNDGELADQIIHPRNKLWKTYFVKVKTILTLADLHKIRMGMYIGRDEYTLPAKAKFLHAVNDKSWVEISMREGKNRQIKRMMEKLETEVLKIKRFSIGSLTLGDLQKGESRLLTQDELAELQKMLVNSK